MNLGIHFDHYRCKQVIKRHSASFYRAFSQIEDLKRRQGVFAVYAFCRHVDDLIDEKEDLPQLLAYKSELDQFVNNQPVRGFRWRALADTRKYFYHNPEDFKPFYEMIEGQEFDAHPVKITSLSQLIHYCDLVASSVGKMLLPILAPNAKVDLTPFALALGRAFQLTNILRDVGEDERRGRIYLPKDLMTNYGYTQKDLHEGVINQSFMKLWEHLAHLAEDYYQEAMPYLASFPKDVHKPLMGALLIYREILNVIRQANYSVMHTKHFVKDSVKIKLLASLKGTNRHE